jgi:hypothetical protein
MTTWRVNMKILKIAVALGLLWFVFYGSVPSSINIITPVPDEIDEVQAIINVDKPSDNIITQVKPVADLVEGLEDRAKFALFNYEFAQRVTRYETDAQQLNDVYSKAGEAFFGGNMRGKYPGLPDGLKGLFVSVVSDDNHVLSMEEKQKLKDLFTGLSWALIER